MKKVSFLVVAIIIAINTLFTPAVFQSDINIESLLTVAAADPEGSDCTGSAPIYCYNGGCGSNSCAIDAGIQIVGCGVTVGGATSCATGLFACCTLRCKCYSNTSYYESQNVADTDMP